MEELLEQLQESYLKLLADSYSQGYMRAVKRSGEQLPDTFDGLVMRSVGRAAGVEARFFDEFRLRARQTWEKALRGEMTPEEAYDRVYADSQRLARTASSRMQTVATSDFMGDKLVYVPTLRGRDPHKCPPDDVCHKLIMGRVFKASTLKANAYSNFGVPKQAWMPCVPLHPNCVHYAIPAWKHLYKQIADMGYDPANIPDEGVYVG